ncbi:MAG: hypothetical protein WCT48_06280 [Candidatus Paceibacterota bacterium]
MKFLGAVFDNDKTAGYAIGAASAILFTPLILPLANRCEFSWIIVSLTYAFIIIVSGLVYSMLPPPEELRGEVPPSKRVKYLKFAGGAVLVIFLGIAWFLHIGSTILLLVTTAFIVYLIAPAVINHILDLLKK